VNDGIEVLERIEAGEDLNSATMAQFARVAGIIYRKLPSRRQAAASLTIHRTSGISVWAIRLAC